MFTCVNEPILQRGDTRLFLVWKLRRCLSFHPVRRHEMQLSASQPDLPGTSSFYFKIFPYIVSVSFSLFFFSCFFLVVQAINKGPSRLPGSTVDIRIPNRLAGNGPDMFHVVETQVGPNSCPSTLSIQQELLFNVYFTRRKQQVFYFPYPYLFTTHDGIRSPKPKCWCCH